MDANTKATPDYASIQKASNALQTLIANKKNEMATTKNQLDDYDGFLDKINAAALINENSIEGTISARLYKVDEKTKYIMDNAEHPTKSYVNLESTLASGFLHALQNHAPEEMNMSESTHGKLLSFFDNTTKDIKTLKDIIEPSIEQQETNKLVAVAERLDSLSELQTTTREQISPVIKNKKLIGEQILEDQASSENQNEITSNQG